MRQKPVLPDNETLSEGLAHTINQSPFLAFSKPSGDKPLEPEIVSLVPVLLKETNVFGFNVLGIFSTSPSATKYKLPDEPIPEDKLADNIEPLAYAEPAVILSPAANGTAYSI